MSKRNLAVELSRLAVFPSADFSLEQHPTDSEIAAVVLWQAKMTGLIENKHVLDLGAGTGILGIGALLIGADKITFVEIDTDAIKVLEENLEKMRQKYDFAAQIKIINQDINAFISKEKYDLAILNPPFGTKNEGVDTDFLECAIKHSDHIISFHKASTKKYIDELIKNKGFIIDSYTLYKFPLKQSMQHHTKDVEMIKVGCWQISKKES